MAKQESEQYRNKVLNSLTQWQLRTLYEFKAEIHETFADTDEIGRAFVHGTHEKLFRRIGMVITPLPRVTTHYCVWNGYEAAKALFSKGKGGNR